MRVTHNSWLAQILLGRGVIERLVQLMHSTEREFKLNALWAFKNLLYKSPLEVKRRVMAGLGWHNLSWYVMQQNDRDLQLTFLDLSVSFSLIDDDDVGIQEQAFHVVRHLAEPEDGIEMVFQEMGEQVLSSSLSRALLSEHEDVVRQVRAHLTDNSKIIYSYSRYRLSTSSETSQTA